MKKSLKAKTPWLHCKYFERSARLIVDGCRFNSLAMLAIRKGNISVEPFSKKVCW